LYFAKLFEKICKKKKKCWPKKMRKDVVSALLGLLGPAFKEVSSGIFGPCPRSDKGTMALDPTYGSFTLLEPVLHSVNRFL